MLAAALLTTPPAVGANEGIPTDGVSPDAAGVPAGGPEGVAVKVNRGPDGLEVEASVRVRAPAAVAWEVLTDYDGIVRFVSSMRESRVSGRGERHVLVEQVAVGRLLLFKRSMRATLFVEEIPPDQIRFEDVLGRDFESYRGEWRIAERDSGVEILYRVAARPSFSVPDFIARGMFRRTAGELLSQVKAEIERRAEQRAPPQASADTTGVASHP